MLIDETNSQEIEANISAIIRERQKRRCVQFECVCTNSLTDSSSASSSALSRIESSGNCTRSKAPRNQGAATINDSSLLGQSAQPSKRDRLHKFRGDGIPKPSTQRSSKSFNVASAVANAILAGGEQFEHGESLHTWLAKLKSSRPEELAVRQRYKKALQSAKESGKVVRYHRILACFFAIVVKIIDGSRRSEKTIDREGLAGALLIAIINALSRDVGPLAYNVCAALTGRDLSAFSSLTLADNEASNSWEIQVQRRTGSFTVQREGRFVQQRHCRTCFEQRSDWVETDTIRRYLESCVHDRGLGPIVRDVRSCRPASTDRRSGTRKRVDCCLWEWRRRGSPRRHRVICQRQKP